MVATLKSHAQYDFCDAGEYSREKLYLFLVIKVFGHWACQKLEYWDFLTQDDQCKTLLFY